jgi:hypothetical protein
VFNIFGRAREKPKEPKLLKLRNGEVIPEDLLEMLREEVDELLLIQALHPEKIKKIGAAALADPKTLNELEQYFQLWLDPPADLSELDPAGIIKLSHLVPWHRAILARVKGEWQVVSPLKANGKLSVRLPDRVLKISWEGNESRLFIF